LVQSARWKSGALAVAFILHCIVCVFEFGECLVLSAKCKFFVVLFVPSEYPVGVCSSLQFCFTRRSLLTTSNLPTNKQSSNCSSAFSVCPRPRVHAASYRAWVSLPCQCSTCTRTSTSYSPTVIFARNGNEKDLIKPSVTRAAQPPARPRIMTSSPSLVVHTVAGISSARSHCCRQSSVMSARPLGTAH